MTERIFISTLAPCLLLLCGATGALSLDLSNLPEPFVVRGRCIKLVVDNKNRLSTCPTEILLYKNFHLTQSMGRFGSEGIAIDLPLPNGTLRVVGYAKEQYEGTSISSPNEKKPSAYRTPFRDMQLIIDGDATDIRSNSFFCEFGILGGRKIMHCYDHLNTPSFLFTFQIGD